MADKLEQRSKQYFANEWDKEVSLGWSEFGLNRHKREAGNSYSSLSPDQIVSFVQHGWSRRAPGQGETGIDRKVVVPVQPITGGFFCPPRAKLVEGMQIKAEVKTRQAGEDPFVETYVEEAEARKHNALTEIPAGRVSIVCYSAEALLENNGTRSTDCDWEIITILATEKDKEPMTPLTMARNFLEMTGGTKSVYSAEEFAESIYYHSTKKGIRVRLEPK